MRWSPEDQQLDVRLHSGAVVVKGPAAPGRGADAGGTAAADGRAAQLDPAAAGAGRAVGRGRRRRCIDPRSRRRLPPEPAPVPERRAGAGIPDWSAQVLAGDFAGVLREARRRGFGQVLDRAPAADVMAAGRGCPPVAPGRPGPPSPGRCCWAGFRARPGRTRRRSCSAGWPRTSTAICPSALRCYDDYLQAAPAGPYRDEALGRQMTATLRLARRRPGAPAGRAIPAPLSPRAPTPSRPGRS